MTDIPDSNTDPLGRDFPGWARPLRPLVDLASKLDWSLQAKLRSSFLIGAALLLGLGVLNFAVIYRMSDRVSDLTGLQSQADGARQLKFLLSEQNHHTAAAFIEGVGSNVFDVSVVRSAFEIQLAELRATSSPEAAALLEVIRGADAIYAESGRRVMTLLSGGNPERALAVHLEEEYGASAALSAAVDDLVEFTSSRATAATASFAGDRQFLVTMVAVFSVGSVVLALVLGYVLSWSIIRPVRGINAVVGAVASGDYTRQAEVSNQDEFGVLTHNVNKMSVRLAEVYAELDTELLAREKAQEDLASAGEVALASSQAKSEFLANMSHEIRTPMNAIIGMAELLSETPLSTEQERYVNIFQAAGQSLLALVNDILDLSKAEAGRFRIEHLPFDLHQLISETVAMLAPRAEEKGLEIRYSIADDVRTALVGDSLRVRQVLTNLIGNAIKFTEAGHIELLIENDPEGKVPGALALRVSDTGVGIPKEKLQLVFEPFTQADSSVTRMYGGTGLGLAISERLVGLIGGRIWAESTVGEGTTFHFTLRFGTQIDRPEPEQARTTHLAGLKALVVDEDATNRKILGEMLDMLGASTVDSTSSENALRKFDAAQELGDPYSLIVLSDLVHRTDSLGIAERIRRDRPAKDVTILMLASNTYGAMATRAQNLGVAYYLAKPVKQPELLFAVASALDDHLEPQPLESMPSLDSPGIPQGDVRVLLVEDSPDNRLLIQAYLKGLPYALDMAENGKVAVEKYTSGEYDLVLMDVQMPVMDGYAATGVIRRMEKEEGRQQMPIIALTANALQEDMQKSLDAGCTAHLSKPITKAGLLQTLTDVISPAAA